MEKYKDYAEDNYIPSINSGVREALEEYAKHIDKEKLRQQMLKAAKDPLFLKRFGKHYESF